MSSSLRALTAIAATLGCFASAAAGYTNFESSHVHPIDLTPAGTRLLAVNTPDGLLEVFGVQPGGGLVFERVIPVGLEPVTVVARSDSEAWVVNLLSDSVNVVDLNQGNVVRTLEVGDEPTDVAFANGKAFVSVAGEDTILVFDLGDLDLAPTPVAVFSRKPRALAVAGDGSKVYAITLFSGNGTTVVNGNVIFGGSANLDPVRLLALGLNDVTCDGAPASYPPLPSGVVRNPALTDPPDGIPRVGLIVGWNESALRWEDETGEDWSHCLPYRLADHDLFVIDSTSLAVSEVDRLGTSLFEVSVHPANGKIYVPHTDARNRIRFEHPLGVRGHIVDNRIAVVDPASSNSVTLIDLNTHINRASDPATNLVERRASVSQPGMMVWDSAGTTAWMTALGSRKVFKIDGGCNSGSCIFGPDRAAPQAVEVAEGPTGVALLEGAQRLYVLSRISSSISVIDTASLSVVAEIPLHDPSAVTVKQGRRFLYDAIDGSGHGDAACSSCHISGDRDDLAWDLGAPDGGFQPYSAPNDNVRFVIPIGGQPTECDPNVCASHDGFDPQKGPMTTQTLRGMLEPLHWRGDRSTFEDFNQAFPGLMGTADIGPINGKPAGLPAPDMASFRQFALGLRFPPNPHRNLDDSLPTTDVLVPGSPVPGNPSTGEVIFNTFPTDAGQPCVSCHTHPFGAAGGKLDGVTPQEPTSSDAAALFNGNADQSQHSDLKVAHMRNMYEKSGPVFGDHVQPPPLVRSGFGFTHDGGLPDLATFFSINVFNLTADQVADVASFSLHFPTGTRPAVGDQLTFPAGTPPTGTLREESRLATLIGLGDLADGTRHCELTASARVGEVMRHYRLSAGSWIPDAAGEPALSTTALREAAAGPVSFLCATLDAGLRMGGDRDEDGVLNADDCAGGDPETWAPSPAVADLSLESREPTRLAWTGLAGATGPSLRYEVLGGALDDLRATGWPAAAGCLGSALETPLFDDPQADPAPGQAWFYLVRGRNPCGPGSLGLGREPLDAVVCP